MSLVGRRRRNLPIGEIHPDLRPGDYWKIVRKDGTEREPDPPCPSNLTGTCWYIVAPIGSDGGYGIGRLEKHTVREHEDGTISVRPGDGSSNSILITGSRGRQWHGYIEQGVWREV